MSAPPVASSGPRVAAVVLAGGRSSRFGRDKAIEPFDGVTLVERVVLAVREVASDVVVVAAAGQVFPGDLAAKVVRDLEVFPGPLVALARGIGALASGFDVVLVVAVDLPRLEPAVLRAIARACPVGGAAVPRLDGALQPLAAAYSRGATERLTAALAAGARSMHAYLDVLSVTALDPETLAADPLVVAADPELASLIDADTPDALRRLRR